MILTSGIFVNKLDTEWNICEYIRHILQSREEVIDCRDRYINTNADLEDSIDIDI